MASKGLGPLPRGLVGGFEGAGATAQAEEKRAGPWLWQEWPCGAAVAEAAAVSTGLKVQQFAWAHRREYALEVL